MMNGSPRHDPVAERDHDARGQRQLRAHALEHRGEGRDHLPQDHEDHDARDRQDRDRVDHRALDLGLQLDVLLDVGRESLQDRVQDTAGLAGRDHVREQVVEGLRVLAHRVRQAGAALDVHAGLLQDPAEGLVLLLAAQDLQALHERQARVDHDRELAREDGERLRRDAAAEPRQGHLLSLLLDRGDEDLLASEQRHHGFLVVGDLLARDGLAVARLALPDESRHRLLPTALIGPPVAPACGSTARWRAPRRG